jgi:hypothetical protein
MEGEVPEVEEPIPVSAFQPIGRGEIEPTFSSGLEGCHGLGCVYEDQLEGRGIECGDSRFQPQGRDGVDPRPSPCGLLLTQARIRAEEKS